MTIYLAGGMGNLSWEEQTLWRSALKVALTDTSHSVKIENPVDYYNFREREYRTQREVMEFDLYKVRTADILIVNFNDPNSIGTAMELAVARERHIPVIGLHEAAKPLHPWLEEHCTRLCESLPELIDHVKKFYLS